MNNTDDKPRLGLIAGGGRFPFLVADKAREQGYSVVAVAFRGCASPELADHVDEFVWVGLSQLGKIISSLKRYDAYEAIMAGKIWKSVIYSPLELMKHPPDLKTISFWYKKLSDKSDATILTGFMQELEAEGIRLLNSVGLLQEYMADRGCMTLRQPTKSQQQDMEFGWKIARELAGLEVGQAIVVKNCAVAAAEAIEGTDAMIRRGGEITRGGATLIKFSRPKQDFRFDVPAIGLDTLQVCKEAGIGAIAVEAERTLMLDKPELLKRADAAKIAVVGIAVDEKLSARRGGLIAES